MIEVKNYSREEFTALKGLPPMERGREPYVIAVDGVPSIVIMDVTPAKVFGQIIYTTIGWHAGPPLRIENTSNGLDYLYRGIGTDISDEKTSDYKHVRKLKMRVNRVHWHWLGIIARYVFK